MALMRAWRERHRRRGKSLAKISAGSLSAFKLAYTNECATLHVEPAASVMDIVDAVLEHKASTKTAVRMSLRRRAIGDEQVSAIAAALRQAPVVRELDLRDNNVTVAGARALSDAMAVHRKHATGEDDTGRRKSLASVRAAEDARNLAPSHYLCKVQLDGNPVAAAEADGFMPTFAKLQAALVVDEEKLRLRRVFRDAVRRYGADQPALRDDQEPQALMTHRGLAKSAKALKVNFKTKEVQARIAAVAEAQGVKAVDVVIDADDFEAVLAPHMAEFRRVAFRERRATEAAATAKILSAMSGTKTAAGKALLGKASASKFAQKMAARRLKKATADLAGDGAVAEAGIETPSTDDADEEKGGGGAGDPAVVLLPGEEAAAADGEGGDAATPTRPTNSAAAGAETAARLPSMDEVAAALNDALQSSSDEGARDGAVGGADASVEAPSGEGAASASAASPAYSIFMKLTN